MGAFLFSCNGRGSNMYSAKDDEGDLILGPDHDVKAISAALDKDLPMGGYFCAGEIGPIGVKGLSTSGRAPTYLHGFTSVLALLYDKGAGQEAEAGGAAGANA